jgi:predicted nucleic acid-binding protein
MIFLDTNVVVYAFDTADPSKQRIAIDILESEERLVISTQVLLETWWTLTRKLAKPLDEGTASSVIDELCQLPVVSTDTELVKRSVLAARSYQLALWDALIVEAARDGRCERLMSEDLQNHQEFNGVVVENPFIEESG